MGELTCRSIHDRQSTCFTKHEISAAEQISSSDHVTS